MIIGLKQLPITKTTFIEKIRFFNVSVHDLRTGIIFNSTRNN